MHDVTKRGLALAVATGGLLITGAAPAVSAVSTHPENPEHAGKKGQPVGGSSHHAAIPVSGTKVKQYAGRHKAPELDVTAPHRTVASHVPASHHAAAPHQGPESHHAAAVHQAAAATAAPGHSATHHAAHTAPVPGGVMAPVPVPAPSQGSEPGDPAEAASSNLGSGGLLAGNTVEVPVNAPVNVCGLVVTVLGGGDSAAGDQCANGSDTAGGPSGSAAAVASDSPGALSGNVVQVPVSLPTNICGDTATVVGGHDSAEDVVCANSGGQTFSNAQAVAANSPGLASGNVVQVPVDAPLNLCGITANAAAVYDRAAGNTCVNGGNPSSPQSFTGSGANAVTANSPGAVAGNVVQVPVEAPINACGDSVSVVGVSNSALDNNCVNPTAGGGAANGQAVGDGGLAAGNVAQLPIDVPTEVCGVVAGVGIANSGTTDTGCTTGPTSPPPPPPPADCFPTPSPLPPLFPTPQPLPPLFPAPPQTPDGPPPPQTPAFPVRDVPPPAPPVTFPYHEETGMLPHTGADVLGYGAVGAGVLVLGAGAVFAARRKSGSAS